MRRSYENIIALPHHVSERRGRMPLGKRAAQFAPFAALSGYGEAVAETARVTEERPELDDDEKRTINDRIVLALSLSERRPRVRVTVFEPDTSKPGGKYTVVDGVMERFDEYRRLLIFRDGKSVKIDGVVSVKGKIFD